MAKEYLARMTTDFFFPGAFVPQEHLNIKNTQNHGIFHSSSIAVVKPLIQNDLGISSINPMSYVLVTLHP